TIDVLAEKRNSGIFAVCPYIDGLLLYDRLPLETLYRVIKAGYDIVIDTEQWHRMTAALSYITRAPERIGFATNERSGLYSRKVPYNQDDYEAVSFLNLVSALTAEKYEFDKARPFLPIPGPHDALSSAISEFRKGKRAVVGIFTGATVPERRWGAKNFAELAEELSRGNIGSVIVGGESEKDDSEIFKKRCTNGYLLDYIGGTTLGETAAVISEVDLFISGDTGLMHIAYGVGTPTLSLFGAGIQNKWAPLGDDHVAINKNEPCSPCTRFGYTPKCPYGVRCLTEISVEEVRESAMQLLARSPNTGE
ncbi:MAG: glycosyltransferase family 9 protein, partial [Thermodesulfobacteriota bacterium]